MGVFPMRSHRSGQITPSHTCEIEVVDFRFWNPDWMQGHDLHESGFVYQHLLDCSWNVWLTSLKEDEVSFFGNRPLCSLAHLHTSTYMLAPLMHQGAGVILSLTCREWFVCTRHVVDCGSVYCSMQQKQGDTVQRPQCVAWPWCYPDPPLVCILRGLMTSLVT